MDKEQLVLKIRETIKNLMKFEAEEVVEVKLLDIMAKDGTKYTTPSTTLGVDSEIYQVDADGNQTPANDGQIELEDGSILTVSKGKVTEMLAAPEAMDGQETPIEDAMAVTTDVPTDETPADIAEDTTTEQRISDLEAKIAEILDMMDKMSMSQVETMEKVDKTFSKVEVLSQEPAGVKITNQSYSMSPEEIRLERILQIKNQLK